MGCWRFGINTIAFEKHLSEGDIFGAPASTTTNTIWHNEPMLRVQTAETHCKTTVQFHIKVAASESKSAHNTIIDTCAQGSEETMREYSF